MSGALHIRNRQRTARVNTRQLRRIALALLGEVLPPPTVIGNRQPTFARLRRGRSAIGNPTYDLGIYIVGAAEMTRLNETFLRHAGSTDVITFDYSDHAPRTTQHATRFTRHASPLHGEIFLCLDEARIQARRFRTTWQSELVRYVVHGLLHLLGHDDHRAADRRKMKREENRLLRRLEQSFVFAEIACRPATR